MFLKKKIDLFLNEAERKEIADVIQLLEQNTSGEIRIAVDMHRNWFEKRKTLRTLALNEFHRLKMHKTRDKTGVLLYIQLDERAFEIIADDGIYSKIGQEQLNTIASALTSYFKQGKFKDGIVHVLQKAGELLALHFPRRNNDTNELLNDISFR